jgi:hypothetical protein
MSIFRRPDYQSDTTVFIAAIKAGDPGVGTRQQEGRSLLWDLNVDRRAQAEQEAARVAQQPYVYQTQAS